MEKIGLQGELDLNKQWNRAVDDYLKDVDRMGDRTAKAAKAIGSEYQKLGGVIAGALATATAAVAGIAVLGAKELTDWTVEGVKSALSLEQQIAGIAAVMGETVEAVGPLEDLISKLALDPTLKVSANEAADAIELLARNGLDMETIIGGAAKNTVLLANATKADFGTAADLVTDVMSIFNIEASDMASAIDGITSVTNNSKFSIDDYRLALARGGVAAQASGVSFDDFNSIIAFTAENFSSGQTAGTGWASLLTRLVPQSEKASDAMKELGLITEEGGNQFFDANGQLKDMNEIIDVVNGAFGGLTEEQRITYAQMIFGRDAAEALFSMIGKTGAEFETFQATLGNTSALQNAETATSTLAAKIEVFRDLMDEIQRQAGKQFFDVLKQIVSVFTDLASENSDKVIAIFGNLADIAETAAEKFLPLVEERLPAMISNLEALTRWISLLISGEDPSEAFADMSPGLQNLITTLDNLKQRWDAFREGVAGVIAIVREALSPITDWIAKHVEWKDVLIAAAGAVAAFLGPLGLVIIKMAAVGAAATAAVALIRNAWEKDWGGVRDFVADAWEKIQGIVKTGMEIITEIFGTGSGTLGTIAETAWKNVKTIINGALDAIQGILNVVLKAIKGDWKGVWDDVGGIFKAAWDTVLEIARNNLTLLVNLVKDNWPAWSAAFGQWASAAWEWIRDTAIPKTVEMIGNWWTALRTYISDNLPAWRAKLAEWAAAAWEWIRDEAIPKVKEWIANWWTGLRDDTADKLPQWREALAEWAAAAWEWIKDSVPKLLKALADWYIGVETWLVKEGLPKFLAQLVKWETAAVSWVGDSLPKLIEAWADWIVAVIEWMTGEGDGQGLGGILKGVKTWIDALWKWVMDDLWPVLKPELEELGRVMAEEALPAIGEAAKTASKKIGEAIIQGIKDGITGVWDGYVEWLSGLGHQMIDAVKSGLGFPTGETTPTNDTGNSFFQLGTNIVGGLISGIGSRISDATAKATELANAVTTAAGDALDSQSPSQEFIKLGETIPEGLGKGVYDNVKTALDAATDLVAQFVDIVEELLNDIPPIAQKMLHQFRVTFDANFDAVIGRVKVFTVQIRDAVEYLLSYVPPIAQKMMIQFRSSFESNMHAVIQVAQQFTGALVGQFDSLAGQLADRGRQAVQGFIDGVGGMIGSAQAKVQELANLAAQAASAALGIQSPSKVFDEMGEEVPEGLGQGIEGNIKVAMKAANLLADSLTQVFDSMPGVMYDSGQQAVQGLVNGMNAMLGTVETIADKLSKKIQQVMVAGTAVSSALPGVSNTGVMTNAKVTANQALDQAKKAALEGNPIAQGQALVKAVQASNQATLDALQQTAQNATVAAKLAFDKAKLAAMQGDVAGHAQALVQAVQDKTQNIVQNTANTAQQYVNQAKLAALQGDTAAYANAMVAAVNAPALATPSYTPPANVSNSAAYTHNSYVYNQMDAAQLEHTIRRIVNGML